MTSVYGLQLLSLSKILFEVSFKATHHSFKNIIQYWTTYFDSPWSAFLFTESAHWADSVIESRCPFVCLSVCLFVCVCVPSPCNFFRGLSLAHRSHDQIPGLSLVNPPSSPPGPGPPGPWAPGPGPPGWTWNMYAWILTSPISFCLALTQLKFKLIYIKRKLFFIWVMCLPQWIKGILH